MSKTAVETVLKKLKSNTHDSENLKLRSLNERVGQRIDAGRFSEKRGETGAPNSSRSKTRGGGATRDNTTGWIVLFFEARPAMRGGP